MEFNDVTVQLYLNNQWVSITDDIISSNGIQLTPRIDGSYSVGTFDAELTREYIPAYTPMKIIYKNNTSYMVCSSASSKYMLKAGLYYHTFEILEATALLSNFIVGTKGFRVKGAYKKDSEKITILLNLMHDKYGIDITNSISATLNNKREFTFGAGTTLFDALSAILADYDLVPIVTQVTSTTAFNIEVVDKNTTETIDYTEADETSIVNKQNMDNYCKFLETEATGVVDRTTTVKWTNLSVRSQDARITTDTCCLVLPNKVEEITKIEASCNTWDYTIILDEYNYYYDFLAWVTEGGIQNGKIRKTFDEIFNYFVSWSSITEQVIGNATIAQKENTTLYKILHSLLQSMNLTNYTYSEVCSNCDSIGWWIYLITDNIDGENYVYKIQASFTDSVNSNANYYPKVDVTSYLKEKAVWDTKILSEKPKFMVYGSGTNIIDNLNKYYKDDFWGEVTNSTVNAWYIQYIADVGASTYSKTEGSSSGTASKGISGTGYIMNALFDVTAKVIADPIIINQKSIDPITETAWKPYARSYNLGANAIEFDKLEERMQLTNDMLGDVELEIEMVNPANLPLITSKKAYKINYNNQYYYVMNYVLNVRLNMVTIKYSLSRKYSKKASVIGVDSQFEATPNPLKSIVTRPIYINASSGTASANLNEYCYLRFKFKLHEDVETPSSGNTGGNQLEPLNNEDPDITLFKRFSILEHGSTKILYCETVNQNVFDYQMTDEDGYVTKINNPVPYVDDYNECYGVSVCLAKISRTDNDLRNVSRALPELYDSTNTRVDLIALTSNVVRIYKDASEHLTFTIKLN